MQGHCTCGAIRYCLTEPPLFVHACHCTWCQRETGTAFAVNAMIETTCLKLLQGQPALTKIASNSGKGQEVVHCPHCLVALYSHYAGAGRAMAFVRVGTLDNPRAVAPDIHIFTSTKLPWITLDDRVPVVPEYYDRKLHWPAASLVRRARALAQDQG